jgi:type IV pilus assembly protein PilA
MIVGVALLLTFGQPCREGPWYPELSWVLLTSAAVLWANHLAEAPVSAFKQIGRVLLGSCRDALLMVLWFVLAAIPLAIVTPTYQCYTPRAKVSEVVLAASTLRSQVEENARARGTLDGSGQGLMFSPSGRTVAGFVAGGGEIIAIGDDPPVVIVLSPKSVESSIKWECRGYPPKIVPMSCRGEE